MTNTTTTHADALASALDDFVNFLTLQEHAYWVDQQSKEKNKNVDLMVLCSTFEVMKGRKYARIVKKDSSSRSAFCFVDLATGDVLKCAGWKAPAKHARGTIFADSPADYGVTRYGAHYL